MRLILAIPRRIFGGEKLVGLKMNVSEKNIKDIVNVLPSLHAPTVAPLYLV